MTEALIRLDSTVHATSDQISSDLDGEVVILYPNTGEYYGLNEVGTWVWNLIQQPKTVNELRDSVAKEFSVSPESCESDLTSFLQELGAEGLIEISTP